MRLVDLVQVTQTKVCPGLGTELAKEFAPHWTEFTESIDVVGARKNRIESAQNISDVLEVITSNSNLVMRDLTIISCNKVRELPS